MRKIRYKVILKDLTGGHHLKKGFAYGKLNKYLARIEFSASKSRKEEENI